MSNPRPARTGASSAANPTVKAPAVEVSAALDRLHHAIDQLEALVSTDPQRAELATLRRSALRLGLGPAKPPVDEPAPPTVLRQFDAARFQRLLELTGPHHGAELLARLAEDLATTRQRSDAASHAPDWPELRGASHVLISLAGSVGAISLQDLAERMNHAANIKDEAGLRGLVPETLDELDALIDIVARTSPVGGQRP